MTNAKLAKRSFLVSLVALLLCFSMLMGTTFAWFTDSVTSENNIIKSGTLSVKMDYATDLGGTWTDASTGKIFDYSYWEPGYTDLKFVRVTNDGNLAFRYVLNVIPAVLPVDGQVNLADVIDVYFLEIPETGLAETLTRDNVATQMKLVGTLSDLMADPDGAAYGILLPALSAQASSVALDAKDEALADTGAVTVALALQMKTTAGNEYQDKSVGKFSVQLLATQYTYENDSFDNGYDEGSVLVNPVASEKELLSALTDGGKIQLSADIALSEGTELNVPAGKTVILELNGKSLSGSTPKADDHALIVNNGTLTIVADSASTLTNTGSNGSALIQNNGALTLCGGNYVGAPLAAGGYPEYAIMNYGELTVEAGTSILSDRGALRIEGGNATLNGGTFVVTSAASDAARTITLHTVMAKSGTTVTINGGHYENNYTMPSGASVVCPWGGDITVYGGTFSDAVDATDNHNNTANFQNYMGAGSVVKVFGGTFDDKTVNPHIPAGYAAKANADGTVTVSKEDIVYDPTVNGSLYEYLPTLQAGDVLVLPEGTYTTSGTLPVPAGVTIAGEAGKTVVIHQSSATQDNIFACAGDVTFRNVTFETNRKGYAVADNTKNHDTDGDITIIDCKFVGLASEKNWGVYKNLYGSLTIENCTFDNYDNAVCGVSNGGESQTVITGCTFTNINGEAIGYVTSTMPATFEADAIANNTGLTADNVIGY
ncbi:MAG: hypothetical protein J6R04_07125 [Clostridia bacterium]|nr:hypothetical protein [Clostridia bacterium]